MKTSKGKARRMMGGKSVKGKTRGGITRMKAGKSVKGKKRGGKR